MSDERPNPVVIRFGNGPAGVFERGMTPSGPGHHAYVPFRSLPHLRMVEAVRADQRPRCTCVTATGTYTFTILDIPEPHLLSIADVEKTETR